ncbi:hypothetical protein SCP_0804810 [Sparassis crispa]|uniref:Uncharacterized protein n=1 Tax=Sparassis crispa TaxID=139825 RepID=A0A401GUQ3_9APHY|nr:hypothetical protein SCP_0804810 [Sparassis crispa]GBE85957.1 hypothetical protein SCP_0804810 [Sparassis crispa]
MSDNRVNQGLFVPYRSMFDRNTGRDAGMEQALWEALEGLRKSGLRFASVSVSTVTIQLRNILMWPHIVFPKELAVAFVEAGSLSFTYEGCSLPSDAVLKSFPYPRVSMATPVATPPAPPAAQSKKRGRQAEESDKPEAGPKAAAPPKKRRRTAAKVTQGHKPEQPTTVRKGRKNAGGAVAQGAGQWTRNAAATTTWDISTVATSTMATSPVATSTVATTTVVTAVDSSVASELIDNGPSTSSTSILGTGPSRPPSQAALSLRSRPWTTTRSTHSLPTVSDQWEVSTPATSRLPIPAVVLMVRDIALLQPTPGIGEQTMPLPNDTAYQPVLVPRPRSPFLPDGPIEQDLWDEYFVASFGQLSPEYLALPAIAPEITDPAVGYSA